MQDILTKKERSDRMRLVRSSNTKPERRVRKLLFSLGYRYRLHQDKLPGKPDLVFPARRKVIFVHGCFWHRHEGCALSTTPASRKNFWGPKFRRNIARDLENLQALEEMGWKALVLWECETRRLQDQSKRIRKFLGVPGKSSSKPSKKGKR